MKPGKTARPSEISVEMITASGEIGIDVMMELLSAGVGWEGKANDA